MVLRNFSDSNWGQDEVSLYVGSEMFGVDFMIRIFEEKNNSFLFEIYKDEKLQSKETRVCASADDANLYADELLTNEINTFSMRIGRGPVIDC